MWERLARALSVLVSMLAYLGLAIAGSGGFHAYFSHAPLVALAIVLAAVSTVAFFAGGNLSRGETEDRSNRWVLIVFFAVGLLLGYLPAYTDREEFWTLDGDTLRWIGVALFGAGTLLRIWPVFVLGKAWSPFNTSTLWSPQDLTVSCVIRAIWGSSSRQSVGPWRFAQPSVSCSWWRCCPHWSRGCTPRSDCSARTSEPSTRPTALGPGG
jgi:hypothetical protein